MAWKGIKHASWISADNRYEKAEYESEEGHELANGTTLPVTGTNDGDLFFKTDTKRLYVYVS